MSTPPAHDDAQYARVLSWPNARELRRRPPPLVLGLLVLGFAIAVSVRAELGTVLNTLSIGFITNLGLYLIPQQHLLVVRIPLLLALAIVPATHAGLRRFHLPVHDDAPEVLGE